MPEKSSEMEIKDIKTAIIFDLILVV